MASLLVCVFARVYNASPHSFMLYIYQVLHMQLSSFISSSFSLSVQVCTQQGICACNVGWDGDACDSKFPLN